MKWEGRCQRGSGGSGDAPSAALARRPGKSHRSGGHGEPGSLPVLAAPPRGTHPDVPAAHPERIRYKTRNTAPVRVMPGNPDPSFPSPFGGGTGGKASRERYPGGASGGFDPGARPLPGSRSGCRAEPDPAPLFPGDSTTYFEGSREGPTSS